MGQGRGDALHAGVLRVVKKHLNPGGVVTLFVQLYESNPAAVKSEIGRSWRRSRTASSGATPTTAQGYDLVLMGQVEPIKIDVDRIEAQARRARVTRRSRSRCGEIGINSAIELFANYAGQPPDLAPLAQGRARSITTATSALQYLAGLGLNLYQSDPIYAGHAAIRAVSRTICSRDRRRRMQALRDAHQRATRAGSID